MTLLAALIAQVTNTTIEPLELWYSVVGLLCAGVVGTNFGSAIADLVAVYRENLAKSDIARRAWAWVRVEFAFLFVQLMLVYIGIQSMHLPPRTPDQRPLSTAAGLLFVLVELMLVAFSILNRVDRYQSERPPGRTSHSSRFISPIHKSEEVENGA